MQLPVRGAARSDTSRVSEVAVRVLVLRGDADGVVHHLGDDDHTNLHALTVHDATPSCRGVGLVVCKIYKQSGQYHAGLLCRNR